MIGPLVRAVRRVVAALRAAVGRVRAALAPPPPDDDGAPLIPVTWSESPPTPTEPAIPRRMPPRKPRVK